MLSNPSLWNKWFLLVYVADLEPLKHREVKSEGINPFQFHLSFLPVLLLVFFFLLQRGAH